MKNNKMKPVNISNESMNNAMSFEEREKINTYLSEISKYKPLSREEEIETVRKAKTDERWFDEFVKHNLLLVLKSAKHFMHIGLPLEDLVQYGNVGLIESARAYVEHKDYYLKNRFNTYAVWYIRKAIIDAFEECGSTVRMTHNNAVLLLKIRKVSDSFEVKNGRAPKVDEIAEMLAGENDDIEKIRKEVKNALNSSMSYYSTDKTVDSDDDESQTYGDLMPSGESADCITKEEDTKTEVNGMLSILTERERKVVTMTFGIGYDYEYEPCAIADRMGLGVERVRQILNESMKKLRAESAK